MQPMTYEKNATDEGVPDPRWLWPVAREVLSLSGYVVRHGTTGTDNSEAVLTGRKKSIQSVLKCSACRRFLFFPMPGQRRSRTPKRSNSDAHRVTLRSNSNLPADIQPYLGARPRTRKAKRGLTASQMTQALRSLVQGTPMLGRGVGNKARSSPMVPRYALQKIVSQQEPRLQQMIKMILDPEHATTGLVMSSSQPSMVTPSRSFQDHDFNAAAAGGNGFVPRGDTFMIVTRNPVWNRILMLPNTAGAVAVYNAVFNNYPAGVCSFLITLQGVCASMESICSPIIMSYYSTVSAFKPHTDKYWAAQWQDLSWIWVDATGGAPATIGTTITSSGINAANFGAGAVLTVTVELWVLGSQTNSTRNSPVMLASRTLAGPIGGDFAGAVINITTTLRGYVALKISSKVDFFLTPGTQSYTLFVDAVTVTLGACDICAHLPIAGFNSLLPSIAAARVTAFSALVSNISPELYKNGDITVAQVGSGALWDEYVGNQVGTSNIASRVGKNNYAVYSWEKGAYAYAKPSSASDYERDTVEVSYGSGTDPETLAFSPYPDSSYLIIYIKSNAPTTTPSTIARFNINTVLQWVSANQMFPGETQHLKPSIEMDTVAALITQQQFFENPLHLMALIPIAKAIFACITAVGAAVGSVASAYTAVRGAVRA